jgi:hypothetical protein
VPIFHRGTVSSTNDPIEVQDSKLLLNTCCEKNWQLQRCWLITASQWPQQYPANSFHEASCAAVFLDPTLERYEATSFGR